MFARGCAHPHSDTAGLRAASAVGVGEVEYYRGRRMVPVDSIRTGRTRNGAFIVRIRDFVPVGRGWTSVQSRDMTGRLNEQTGSQFMPLQFTCISACATEGATFPGVRALDVTQRGT